VRGGILIMKVGIIVHSYTGNTLSVAQRLNEVFLLAGHSVSLERVSAINEDPSSSGNIQLKTIPDTSTYDILIFGAPVRAFSLSPVMKAYLSQLPSLKGKKVSCFVTESFPYAWMGGNRAIEVFKKACESKGGDLLETGVVNWPKKMREKKITEVLEKLSKL
jgi:flavodoxin